MEIERFTKQDFDDVLLEHGLFWDSDLTYPLHHPVFVNELGDTAYVIRDEDKIAAYLLGFFAQTGPVAYVHLVAVRPGYRGRGLARKLYGHFALVARGKGCRQLKATASPLNDRSLHFHESIGMVASGEPNERGVVVQRDYIGPGRDRVVFLMDLDSIEAETLMQGV